MGKLFWALIFAVNLSSTWVFSQTFNTTYQSSNNSGITNTLTRSCFVRTAGSATSTSAWVTEGQDLFVRLSTGYALVDFPLIIGTNPGQIPPGANIVSAKLKLYCLSVGGSVSLQRVMTARPICDFDRMGTWFEPAAPVTQALLSGVNWVRRDGRPGVDRPWDLLGTLQPSTSALYPSLLSALPGIEPSIIVDISANAAASSYQAGEFHSFEVGPMVELWAGGLSNQGFLIENNSNGEVIYAADDYPVTAQRPRLEITWQASGGLFFNRVPEILGTYPSTLSTTTGRDMSFVLNARDPDRPPPLTFEANLPGTFEYVVLVPPSNGSLITQMPFVTYRPNPGFTGTDSFSWTVKDALSIAYPRDTSLSVVASPGTSTTILREGSSPASNLQVAATKMTGTRISPSTSIQATFEDNTIKVFAATATSTGRGGYLEFPGLIGTGVGQIPPGSTIVHARLEMTLASISTPGLDERLISLHRLIDPLNRGTSWVEPAEGIIAPESTGCFGCGVTWLYPDSADTTKSWHIPGGDIHPGDQSTVLLANNAHADSVLVYNVTPSVAAWASGMPNFGWAIRSTSPNTVTLYTDDELDTGRRPRLMVTYRVPASGPTAEVFPPQANAGPDQDVRSMDLVRLDGRGTFRPYGGFLAYYWWQVEGPPVTLVDEFGLTPTFIAPSVPLGQTVELKFILAAYADALNFTLDTATVRVSAQPNGTLFPAPTVSAGNNFSIVELTPVTLTATASAAPGATLTYRWTQIAGPFAPLQGATLPAATFTAPAITSQSMTMVFDLEVTQTIGTWTTTVHDEVAVTVFNTQNTPPSIQTLNSITVETGTWVLLDASQTTDADGHSLSFEWIETGGSTLNVGAYQIQMSAAAATTPVFVPETSNPVTYSLQLRVSDGEATSTANITIQAIPPLPSFSGSLSSNPMGVYRDTMTSREARHLLRRLGGGTHPDDVTQVRTQGLIATLNSTLNAPTPASVVTEAFHFSEDIANPSNADPGLNQVIDPYPQFTISQIEAYWYTLALRNPAFFNERWLRFLHGRLACSARTVSPGKQHWGLLHSDLLRSNLYGSYRDILLSFTRDALTLAYIDGFDSIFIAPNENYAREFFELHTLGLSDENGQPIFNDTDVREAARAFTGWRASCVNLIPGTMASCYPAFVSFFFDAGQKTILGVQDNFNDEDIVDLVLSYDGGDNAARFLAKGLLEHFVVPNPPQTTIAALAQVILSNNWQILPILQTLLRSNAMFAPEAELSLVKSPVDLVNHLTRTLRVPLQTRDLAGGSSSGMTGLLRLLNHRLGNPEDVNGFTRDLDWVDEYSAVRRYQTIRRILTLGITPTPPLLQQPGGDYPGISDQPVDLSAFLPPDRARYAPETLRSILKLFDIRLKEQPVAGTSASEFDLALQYLNNAAQTASNAAGYSTVSAPFNGNGAGNPNKLWGLLHLLFNHPEFLRF